MERRHPFAKVDFSAVASRMVLHFVAFPDAFPKVSRDFSAFGSRMVLHFVAFPDAFPKLKNCRRSGGISKMLLQEKFACKRGTTELKETSTNIDDDSMSQGTSAIEEDDSSTNQELQTDNTPSVPCIAAVRRKTARPEKEVADRLFLLSLLPMFHECSLQTKLWARIKIQDIMQQALQFRHPTESLPP
ncbi:hypothetical protein NQ314_015656 [Rhamnusium bicolor]|uniref:BESS domain-containing protein n=1 Tax=Rhamnusium bicolor TaxID=1586634 RepID=A0AAV8WZ59_9CUCU|nr:hypothetical protein NQ314_015656 [Rhamnusium bicolor]